MGDDLSKLWTDEEAILAKMENAQLGIVLAVPPYSVMMCLLGVLRGAGLQARGAVAVGISFYVFGLPFGAWMGLYGGFDLLGVFLGNVIGLTLSAVSMTMQVYFVDWGLVIA